MGNVCLGCRNRRQVPAGQVIYLLYRILFTFFTVYRPEVGKFLSVKGRKEIF